MPIFWDRDLKREHWNKRILGSMLAQSGTNFGIKLTIIIFLLLCIWWELNLILYSYNHIFQFYNVFGHIVILNALFGALHDCASRITFTHQYGLNKWILSKSCCDLTHKSKRIYMNNMSKRLHDGNHKIGYVIRVLYSLVFVEKEMLTYFIHVLLQMVQSI